ncbi:protein of unknown function [Geodermatophilus telluris]|uniref:DUF4190 domain-containing protein n=1 Tax=Geodermatophilus telluris TaxID=1190417 RepID=A0A1G6MKL8_9ACTN|nr:DUF4190 domain-containing protein [Geodermatophilus telluris]SDC55814.1 protein of unknown function [Geodermatophilus telluris]
MSSSQDPSGYGSAQAYGPPPPGWPPYRRPTNTLAILALVFAFVASPAGLVLGILARRQIRQTGEEGDGLALAGIVIGGIGTALAVLGVVVAIVVVATVGASFAP